MIADELRPEKASQGRDSLLQRYSLQSGGLTPTLVKVFAKQGSGLVVTLRLSLRFNIAGHRGGDIENVVSRLNASRRFQFIEQVAG
ncbi:MAG: hypothetical protein ACP5SH_01270 [Syntrophobacteraceae bacterium]